MNIFEVQDEPKIWSKLEDKCTEIGFTMPSDKHIGCLLKTLMQSKPGGNFLELGTGIGLSLCWMIEGLTENAKVTSVDNDPELIAIADSFFAHHKALSLVCEDGSNWLKEYTGEHFDLIFADAWPGKYSDIETALDLLKVSGLYVIDDMSFQENWPEGHAEKVEGLVTYLENRSDLVVSKLNYSTGIIIATKIPT